MIIQLCEHGCGQPATYTTKGSSLSGAFRGRPVHQCAKSHNSCPAVKLRKVETSLQKYGTAYPWQTSEILSKRAQTNIEKYGHACSLRGVDVERKRKNTIKERYGFEHHMKNTDIKTRASDGLLQAHKSDPTYRRRVIETRRDRYGDDFSDIVDKIRRTQVSKGRWIDPSTRSQWYEYKRKVRRLTRKNYEFYRDRLNPSNLPLGTTFYQVDHIYSIKDGFQNNIPYQVIANVNNLRVIWHTENKKKHTTSDISIQELISKIMGA